MVAFIPRRQEGGGVGMGMWGPYCGDCNRYGNTCWCPECLPNQGREQPLAHVVLCWKHDPRGTLWKRIKLWWKS